MQAFTEHYNERTFLICVNTYKDSVPTGYYYSPFHEEVAAFKSLTQLLLKLEQCLDVENIPQAFQKVRTFFPAAGIWDGAFCDMHGGNGKLATFVVQVYFRRNASWQGTVEWLNEKKNQKFRSVLELICLLDSALCEKGSQDWQPYDKAL